MAYPAVNHRLGNCQSFNSTIPASGGILHLDGLRREAQSAWGKDRMLFGFYCQPHGAVVGFSAVLLVCSTVVVAEPVMLKSPPAACWAPADLAHKSGDEIARRDVAEAFLDAPRRSLATFSPKSQQRGVIRRVNPPRQEAHRANLRFM